MSRSTAGGGAEGRPTGRCNEGRGYGLVVRVPCGIDLRRFPPIPRATRQFERRYKGRTAVERVNARMKVFWGADDGNLTGARRFHGYVGVVMVICVAFATLLAATPRKEGSLGDTRLGPIALALREAALGGESVQAGERGQGRGQASRAPGGQAGPADTS